MTVDKLTRLNCQGGFKGSHVVCKVCAVDCVQWLTTTWPHQFVRGFLGPTEQRVGHNQLHNLILISPGVTTGHQQLCRSKFEKRGVLALCYGTCYSATNKEEQYRYETAMRKSNEKGLRNTIIKLQTIHTSLSFFSSKHTLLCENYWERVHSRPQGQYLSRTSRPSKRWGLEVHTSTHCRTLSATLSASHLVPSPFQNSFR